MPASIAERYVRLVRGVDALLPGFVDSYSGPPAWTPTTGDPARLDGEAQELLAGLDALDDPARARYLHGQLVAARTALRMVEAAARGERIPYAEEVEGLFGIVPRRVPEATFAAARHELDGALGGTGPLAARLEALRARLVVPAERLLAVLEVGTAELRERSRALAELPDGESFAWEAVRGQPWRAYNWYLGDRRSRNEVNVDLPWHLHELPDIVAHEGYPGHHLERITKAVALTEPGHRPEVTAQLLLGPEALLSEAIAVCALDEVASGDALGAVIADVLAPAAGLAIDEETLAGARAALRVAAIGADAVANAALLLMADGASESEVVAYLVEEALVTPERARQLVSFIVEPVSRAYVFTYSEGGRLLRAALDAAPDASARRARYGRALAETLTPDDLRAWA